MRLPLFSAVILSLIFVATSAVAQPRAVRRGKGPPKPPPAHGASKPGPTAVHRGQPARPNNEAICRQRSALMRTEQGRIDEARADLSGIDAEIAQLERRLTDLRVDKSRLEHEMKARETNIGRAKTAYDKDCSTNETCEQYERMVTEMEQQTKPFQEALERIRKETADRSKQIAALRRRIDPLRAEYQRLGCDNLVPGETQQSTIDRCMAIFSEWNRLQAELNDHNNRLPALRSQYQRLLSQMQATDRRASNYETYLAANCKRSKKLGVVRGYKGVHTRARSLEQELDKLVEDVTKLRGVRITVEPKR